MGPFPDPTQRDYRPFPQRQPSSAPKQIDDEDTQPRLRTPASRTTPGRKEEQYFQEEPAYHEHVTGSLAVPSSEAPKFRPVYQPYPAPPVQWPAGAQRDRPQQPFYPGYPGYGQIPYNGQRGYAYPPYGGYYPGYYHPYGWGYPQKPRRSGYQLGVAITSFVGSILSVLAGFGCLLIFLVLAIMPTASSAVRPGARFGGLMEFLAFAVAGLGGGGVALYHSIRAWFFYRKPSARFKLPWFWTFLLLYLVVIAVGTYLYFTKQSVTYPALTIILIALAGILPAMTIMSLALRRIHFPRQAQWPTTWRRFALSLISGSTLAILLALIFELVLSVVVSLQLGQNVSLDNPDQPIPNDPRAIWFLFILVSVIAPLVEETVKPLAVVILIGRVRSAAEAFVLGLACGIGFDLVETTGYIGQGYQDWLAVALQRSSAGLLHGFGAGMTALGWYFITHPGSTRKVNRVLLASGCWCYAILQHALWNGSFGLQLLPAPIGPYLDKGTIPLGPITFPSFLLVYVVESVLMLIFFLYVTRKLRARNEEQAPPASVNEPNVSRMEQPGRAPQMVARV
jgi:RsiW-degrading membrane proteinase PrsW (M82 family)